MRRQVARPNRNSPTLTIENKRLLLVEGKDEVYFFGKMFKELALMDQIQIIEIGGVERMNSTLSALMLMPNFESVQSIGIIRDADDSVESALQSLRNILGQSNLPAPAQHNSFEQGESDLKVGVFIMPGSEIDGTMLEDLCLKTVEDQPYLPLIERYLSQLEAEGLELPSNIAKSKVQIYLASQKRIVHSLGLGAQRGYWNLNHSSLEDVKRFLHSLIS